MFMYHDGMKRASKVEDELQAYLIEDEDTLVMPRATLSAMLGKCIEPEPRPTVPATPWAIKATPRASGMRRRVDPGALKDEASQ
jgi:hypothetical protein